MSGTDSDAFFTECAGHVAWPRTSGDLTDPTRCPACQRTLASPVCANCGLDLRHPAAVELLAVSTDAAASLEKRLALIGRIRYDTDQAFQKAAREVAATAAVWPVRPDPAAIPAALPMAQGVPTATTPPRAVPAASAPAPALAPLLPPTAPPAPPLPTVPARPKRSSVQILMLVVGVLLVAVAAIFFLTLAWLFAGLAVRSLIGAVLTLVALTIAAVLRRRGLTATAEGIGALAVVLVVLDAWAMRENNLLGLASTDGLLYWGIALSLCSVLFLAWHALSRLRVASVAGFLAAPLGLALLAAGLASGLSDPTRLFLAFLAAAIATLLHRATLPAASPETSGRWPSVDRVSERMALVGLGSLALVSAAVTATLMQPASTFAPLWALGAVTIVAALHVIAVLTATVTITPAVGSAASTYRFFAYGCSVLATAAACTIAPVMAARAASLPLLLTAPVLLAVTLALALEFVGRRLRAASPERRAVLASAATAAVLATSSVFPVVGFALWPFGTALAVGLTGNGSPVAEPSMDSWWALLTLAATGALAGLFWWRGGLLRARAQFVTWLALAIVVAAAPFAGALWLVLTLYLAIGALALAALLRARAGRHTLGAIRVHTVVLLITATTLGYLIGWASSDTWWVGTLFVVAILGTSRLLFDARGGHVARGMVLSGALLFALSAAGIAPWALTLGADPSYLATQINVVSGLALAAGLFQLLLALCPPRLLSDTERCWAFCTLLLPTVIVSFVPLATFSDRLTNTERTELLFTQPLASVLAAALLAAAAATWVLRSPVGTALRWPRLIAAAALAPALLLLVDGLLEATDAPASVLGISAALVALATCSLALARLTDSARPALEIGAGLVLVPSLVLVVAAERPLDWLALVLAGLAALVVAVAPDGLFASRSARRHFGWLAIVLGTAGLWLGLARGGTDPVEPYVLPLAGLLLVTAALVRRFGRVPRAEAASPVAALLTFVGLLVALAPLAVAAQSGSLVRPLIIGAVSAVLLIGAAAITWTPPRSAYLAAAGAAGAIGLFVTGAGRALDVLEQPGMPDGRLELWLLVPCASAVVAAFLLAGQHHAVAPTVRTTASRVLLIGALVLAAAAETSTLVAAPSPDDAALLTLRMALLVIVLSGVHVLALHRSRAPLGAVTAWASIGLAGVCAFAALSVDALDPDELLTVPVGTALVLGQLGRTGSAVTRNRGIIVVTSGLAIALLPSAFNAGDDTLLRPILLLIAGGTLAIAGALMSTRPRNAAMAAPFCGIGVLTVAVTATARIAPLLAGGPGGPTGRLEAWLLPAVLIIGAAGATLIVAHRRAQVASAAAALAEPQGRDSAIRVGYALIAGALVGFTVAEMASLNYTPLAATRVILVVWVFAAAHLALFWLDRTREGRQLSWLAIVLGAFAILAGLLYSVPDPVELVTAPLAVALLVSGWLHLERVPAARSWRWCAPGLVLLLVPSLLLDLGESALWRIVALGVVAVIVIVVGLVQRLQAPFVIGAVVLLIHGTAQLWPWISLAYGAVPWWLWLGAGGVLLIVLAARYEQRIRNFTSIALKISVLR